MTQTERDSLVARLEEAAVSNFAGALIRVRHKKRGTEYEVIGVGKMQAETWADTAQWHPVGAVTVDMREVTIYRGVDDGELWVRPREEFEDGRFEALAASLPSTGAPDENDGLELCGNFSATDPITDEDRLAYWKGAYERMAERNFRLNNALRQIRDQHIPDQPSAYGGSEFDWVVRQYANLRRIAKDAVEG